MRDFILPIFLVLFCNLCFLNAQGGAEVTTENKAPSLTQDTLNYDRSTFYIDFIGAGDLQKSYAQGDQFNGNTGIGVLLERFNHSNKALVKVFDLEGRLNVASTSDSIIANIIDGELQNRREFGSYILNPVSRKQSLYLNANMFFNIGKNYKWRSLFKWISGVNFRVITSNNAWKFEDKISHLGALNFRVGIFHEFVPILGRLSKDEYGRTKYSVYLGVNYSWRSIYGDISAEDNSDDLLAILGTDQTAYSGFELNFGFRINALRAEFQMPIIRKNSDSVEGLTNTQFLYSIRFLGSLADITSSHSRSNQKKQDLLKKQD